MSSASKLEYFVQYNMFLLEKAWDERNGEIRFSKVTPKFVKDVFTEENINLVSGQVNTRNWAKIQDNMPAEMNKNKKVVTDIEWIESRQLPKELLNDPKIFAFVKDSKIYSHMAFYKHSFQIYNGELSILVDGKQIGMKEVLNDFSLKKDGKEYFIIHKETGKRYCYLEEGLIQHDPQTEIKPLRSLTSEETPKEFTAVFYGIKEGHTNSAGGISRYDRHTFAGVKTPGGKLYTFGALSKGSITCPDPYSYIPKKHVEVEFAITEEQFEKTLGLVSKEQSQNESFNIVFKNCSSFGGRVAKTLDIPASPQTVIGENDNLENRIKAFAFSKEISKEVKKQANAKDTPCKVNDFLCSNVPEIIMSNDKLTLMQKMITLAAVRSHEKELKAAVDSIINEAKKDSEITLTEKFYNLATDIFEATKGMTVSHSNVLFSQLQEIKEKQQRDEKIDEVVTSVKSVFAK